MKKQKNKHTGLGQAYTSKKEVNLPYKILGDNMYEPLYGNDVQKLANKISDKIGVGGDISTSIIDLAEEETKLYYNLFITAEVFEDEDNYPNLYAIGTTHKFQDKYWSVIGIDFNILKKGYDLAFREKVDYTPASTGTATFSGLEPIKKKLKISDFLDKEGIPSTVFTQPTEREKMFNELCEGILS